MTEKEKFDSAMDKLLKANPAVVRSAMGREKIQRAEERKQKKLPHTGVSMQPLMQLDFYRFAGNAESLLGKGLTGCSLVLVAVTSGYEIRFPEGYTQPLGPENRRVVLSFDSLAVAKKEFARIKEDILDFGYEIST